MGMPTAGAGTTGAEARRTTVGAGTTSLAATTGAGTTSPAATTGAPGGDVRWLTAEQQQHWRAFRDGTVLLLEALSRDLEECAGLSTHEYEVMVRLSEAPDHRLRMSQLATNVAHSRSRLTHTIARMEGAGLVERVACSSDARGVNCLLTDAGWRALVDAAPGHVASVREHLVDVLSGEELAALGAAMGVVGDRLRGADAAR